MTQIHPISMDRLPEVLLLAFSNLTPESQAARVESLAIDAEAGRLTADGIFEARLDGQLVGAIFSQLHGGSAGVIWPPAIMPDEPESTARRLLDKVLDHFQSSGIRIANMLLDREEMPILSEQEDADSNTRGYELLDLIEQAGFQRLATLLYMMADTDSLPTEWPTGAIAGATSSDAKKLCFVPVLPQHDDRWCSTIDATFVDTLDCPGLDALRSSRDVIDGYLASGSFRPDFWNIIQLGGKDVGCLILIDHPDQSICELAYMGLIPEARGHGRGRTISRYAQWLTHRASRDKILVGVDESNPPAKKAYESCGFQQWDQKTVYVRQL